MTEAPALPPNEQSGNESQPSQPLLPGFHVAGMQFVQTATHSGPVPVPQVMAGYGEIDSSFPNRIMTMAEANAVTGRKTAERAQTFMLAERLVARVLGFLFAVAALGIATYLTVKGHDTVAGVVAGTTVVGVTVALISGKAP